VKSGERSVVVTLDDQEMDYLSGHVIDGRNLFPAMGYLVSFTLLLFCMKLRFDSRVQVLNL
jgi:fatty acid synthase